MSLQDHHFLQHIVNPTTDAGSLLDHIYTRNVPAETVHTEVVDCYYSDHDLVTYIMSNKSCLVLPDRVDQNMKDGVQEPPNHATYVTSCYGDLCRQKQEKVHNYGLAKSDQLHAEVRQVLPHCAAIDRMSAESMSISDKTVQYQDEMLETVDMDIILTGEIPPPMPIHFSPLTIHQRKVICHRYGFTLGKDQCAVSLKYIGVGHCCIGAPVKKVKMGEDGNCLFRAYSYLLTGSEAKHDVIRDRVCDYISDPTNWMKLHSYIEDHNNGEQYILRNKMNLCGTWGTEVELFAFAQLTGKDIVVYTLDHWLHYCSSGTMQHTSRNAFYLDNSMGNHYDAVLGVVG